MIIPNLYVGDIFSVKNMTFETKQKIKRIVNTAYELNNIAKYPTNSYMHIKLKDVDTFDDIMLFNDSIKPFLKFIEEEQLDQSPVLIHCHMGISRSCSMIAVYLIHKDICKNFKEAMDFIIEKRPHAFNGGNWTIYSQAIDEHFEVPPPLWEETTRVSSQRLETRE